MKFMNKLMMEDAVLEKYEHLKTILKNADAAVIAFSGGVDSVFLMAAAAAAGMGRLLAVTLVSGFFAQKERERAAAIAKNLGVAHLCLELDILGKFGCGQKRPQAMLSLQTGWVFPYKIRCCRPGDPYVDAWHQPG